MIISILHQFKIEPTNHRTFVLGMVLSKKNAQFSAEDIVRESKNHKTVLNKSVVNKTLRLFCVRGIIQMVNQRKTLQRGRPESLFTVSPQLLTYDANCPK
jgi:Fe2+ or Zn2+ uptake regulation protein